MDQQTDAVLILTRHGSHAHFVTKALRAGKHIFVEKPLALNEDQLHEVAETYKAQYSDAPKVLMVGFNRRFAPTAVRVRELLAGSPGPFIVYVRANAGYVPPESWVHDPAEGGGRIIGEVCHFVDLIQYLTGGLPIEVHVVPAERGAAPALHDNVVINLRLDNGSSGCIVYSSGGDKSFPREYVEVFGNGVAAVIDNFKTMKFVRAGKKKKMRAWGVDRGHAAEMKAFVDAIRKGGQAPVAFREYVATTLATFAMMESLRQKAPVAVDADGFLRDV